jgi:hypothetical protein
LAVDEAHDVEDVIVDDVDSVNRDDVRMCQPSRRAGLEGKSLAGQRIDRDRRRQHLDRDGPVQAHLACQIHDPHPATPKLAIERVPALQGLLQREEEGVRRVKRAERRHSGADH